MTIRIQAQGFDVAVKRSARRKTMALKVNNGEVSIYLPGHYPLKLAQDFIVSKSGWIIDRLAEQQQIPQRSFAHGSQQPMLGAHYPLLISQQAASRQKIEFDGEAFYCQLPATTTDMAVIKSLLKKYYRQQACDYLIERCQQLANQYDFTPGLITVRHYKSRWGSCRSNGDIQLNWQLIQAPLAIIDYVIIHELCHLQHLNHSRKFWDLVARFAPDYQQHRNWLKQHGQQLIL